MKTKLVISIFSLVVCFCVGCDTESDATFNPINVEGVWRVSAIHNSTPQGPTVGAPDDEDIIITFLSDGTFTGTTTVNTFDGNYAVNGTTLRIVELLTTEVGETSFGFLFYDALDAAAAQTNVTDFELSFSNTGIDLGFNNFQFISLTRE